jgi:hypothetical protein
MTKNEIYSEWAPAVSPWSPWVKPVLFAHLCEEPEFPAADQVALDIGWVPPIAEKTAIIVDIPGAESALMGLSLAGAGYRPVPLYNALPLPAGRPTIDDLTGRPTAAVDVRPILACLGRGAERLTQLHLPAESPPAFLLDANRGGDGRVMRPEEFDNRSISFTTDFPSATFFGSQGIKSFLLVQAGRAIPQADLAHSLRRWQEADFPLRQKDVHSPLAPVPLDVPRPAWFGAMFQRALASLGLRRAPHSGFGAWIPDPSAGG